MENYKHVLLIMTLKSGMYNPSHSYNYRGTLDRVWSETDGIF